MSSSPIPLSSQVGGHPGVLTSEDGSIVFKPALPLELEFYQTHVSNPVFEPLRPFLPTFLGTLKLHGKIDESDHENLAVKLLDEAKGTKDERCHDWVSGYVCLSCPSLYSRLC
jgi:1D-myo-inositol-tetrakisphosphate 5-kinase/inositol-polyphosphate multikinase